MAKDLIFKLKACRIIAFNFLEPVMKYTFILIFALIFSACSTFNKKDDALFNLTPSEWFAQILSDIRDKNLDNADEHYISFASEHINSDYLPQTVLILSAAHTAEERYTMANFYLDEYIKRFGDTQGIEYAKFLKIKANFDSFAKPNRNQTLMLKSIDEVSEFLAQYPNSQYRPLIETMLAKLHLAQTYLHEEIASLYERRGREDSAQIYRDRLEQGGIGADDFVRPTLPWYMRPFE